MGAERTARALRGADFVLRAELQEASEAAADVVEALVRKNAPIDAGQGHPNSSKLGVEDVTTRVTSPRRFSGNVAVSTYRVEIVMRGLAAWIEGGTGIYASPRRGGPFTPWTVYGNIHFKTEQGEDVFARSATIRGARPMPYLDDAVRQSFAPVNALYEAAVGRATARMS